MGEQAGCERWNWPLGCSGIGYYWASLGWEELWSAVRWSLNGGCLQSFGKLLPQVGSEFDPLRFGSLLHGGDRELYPLCQYIIMSLGVPLGQGWKGREHALHLSHLICPPQGLRNYKGSHCLPRILMCSLFVTSLASAPLSIIPL